MNRSPNQLGAAVRSLPAGSELALSMIEAYYAEMRERLPGGFDLTRPASADSDELSPPEGDFLVLFGADDVPLGCGGLRRLEPGVIEIKRLWVAPHARSQGLGRVLLDALEARAAELGGSEVRLDTSDRLAEAGSLYRSAGYRQIEPYNENPHASLWFSKDLD